MTTGDEIRAVDEPRGDRIAKFLSRAGIASRRDAEKMLAEGAIKLNGKAVTHPATFVSPGDIVQVNGRVVDSPDRTRMWRYHKPEGLVTTHRDPEGRPTVFDKLRQQLPRVISVGRLDLTSEGLLLLTTTVRWRGRWNCPRPAGFAGTGCVCMARSIQRR